MKRGILLAVPTAAVVLLSACSKMCGVKTGDIKPGSAEDFATNVRNTVYFHYDRADLVDSAKAIVADQAKWLKTYSGTSVTVEGHTDTRGTAEYNMALGQRRSNTVKNALTAEGIEASRIDSVSYGKERVVDQGTDETAHAKNRRAITVVR